MNKIKAGYMVQRVIKALLVVLGVILHLDTVTSEEVQNSQKNSVEAKNEDVYRGKEADDDYQQQDQDKQSPAGEIDIRFEEEKRNFLENFEKNKPNTIKDLYEKIQVLKNKEIQFKKYFDQSWQNSQDLKNWQNLFDRIVKEIFEYKKLLFNYLSVIEDQKRNLAELRERCQKYGSEMCNLEDIEKLIGLLEGFNKRYYKPLELLKNNLNSSLKNYFTFHPVASRIMSRHKGSNESIPGISKYLSLLQYLDHKMLLDGVYQVLEKDRTGGVYCKLLYAVSDSDYKGLITIEEVNLFHVFLGDYNVVSGDIRDKNPFSGMHYPHWLINDGIEFYSLNPIKNKSYSVHIGWPDSKLPEHEKSIFPSCLSMKQVVEGLLDKLKDATEPVIIQNNRQNLAKGESYLFDIEVPYGKYLTDLNNLVITVRVCVDITDYLQGAGFSGKISTFYPVWDGKSRKNWSDYESWLISQRQAIDLASV